MATRRETGWQCNRTVLECNKYMLESGILSDVTFEMHSQDGTTSNIAAHRYMLVSRSPVFEALLCGGFDSSNDTKFPISDVEPEAFTELLRFVYCEELNLTTDNVLPILYAAKKYLLQPLVRRCMEFLERKISMESVCTILDHSILYEESELKAKCISYIATRCNAIICTDSFLSLSPAGLSAILECNNLYVHCEQEILEACIHWAEKRVQKSDVTDTELRTQLGENLRKIRFATMTPAKFAEYLGMREILTDTEKSLFYYYLLTGLGAERLTQMGFYMHSRISKCVRYTCLGRTAGWWTCNGPGDAVSFTVDQPVTLLGISLYGGREESSHKVTLEVWKQDEILIKRIERTIQSNGSDRPIPIFLDGDQTCLEADMTYTILALIRGPIVYYGQGGTDVVKADHVTFTFSRSDKSGNGTNIKSGQIPEILFLKTNGPSTIKPGTKTTTPND